MPGVGLTLLASIPDKERTVKRRSQKKQNDVENTIYYCSLDEKCTYVVKKMERE